MSPTSEQIQNVFEQEQKSNREPKTIDDLSFSYEAITPEWLTAVLCKDNLGVEVVPVKLDTPDNGNTNR